MDNGWGSHEEGERRGWRKPQAEERPVQGVEGKGRRRGKFGEAAGKAGGLPGSNERRAGAFPTGKEEEIRRREGVAKNKI